MINLTEEQFKFLMDCASDISLYYELSDTEERIYKELIELEEELQEHN